jgi:hypothetical protein
MGYPNPNLELSDYEGDDEFDERDWLLGSQSSWFSDNGRGYWARLHSWVSFFFFDDGALDTLFFWFSGSTCF